MTCVASAQTFYDQGTNLAAILGPVLGGFFLVVVAMIIALLYWRKLIADLATYKQNWNKRRSDNQDYVSAFTNLVTHSLTCYVAVWQALQDASLSCYICCLPNVTDSVAA